MIPTHEIDVTEFEAWQLIRPPQWGEEWRTLYLDDRSNDPTFKTEFSTLGQKCLNFVYRGDIIVATVIQWLGSNCGLSFLHEVNKRTDSLLTKRIQ